MYSRWLSKAAVQFSKMNTRMQRDIESCVPMRLYYMTRFQLATLFVGLLLLFCVTLLVGLHGPNVLFETNVLASKLSERSGHPQLGPFVIDAPSLSVFNQELWLYTVIKRGKRSSQPGLFINMNVTVEIKVQLELGGLRSTDQSRQLVSLTPPIHRRVTLNCLETVCDELFLAHIVPIDYTNYVFTVQFDGLANSESQLEEDEQSLSSEYQLIRVTDVDFRFRYYNTRFTYLELISRFVCFVISEASAILFITSLRNFALRDWTLEQKYTALLLPVLMLFNNPFYPVRYFTSSWLAQWLTDIFQATFVAAVLLFWLCIYHGLRATRRTICCFYMPKLLIVCIPWLTFVVFSAWNSFNQYSDPTFNVSFTMPIMMYVGAVFIFFGFIYVAVFLILVCRAFIELGRLAYNAIRLKALTSLSCLMIVVVSLAFSLRFSSWNALTKIYNFSSAVEQQSVKFVQPSLSGPWYRSAAEFSIIYGIVNAYGTALAIIYSPSKQALRENHFKDDPSLSMINDSDEDIMYESDTETLRLRPVH